MKAVWVERFAPYELTRVCDVPEPQPGPGQVLVAVHAAEANYPDILVMEGKYQIKPPLPFSPGKAAAGVVAGVGTGVSRFKIGDRVSVQVEYGAYAESLVCDQSTCYPLPDSIGFTDAAALGLVYQTAHYALKERTRMQRGEHVLVLGGSGGIGVASIQLARAFGAGKVIAGVLGEENAALAREVGADHCIELKDPDLRDSLRAQVSEFTDGHGVDVVIDPVGGDSHTAALRAMAWRARMVIIGFASGVIPTIKSNYLLVKNIEVSGLQWSDYRERDPGGVAEVQADLFSLFTDGKIRPHISSVYPLERFADALRLLNGAQAQGKLILQVRET